MNEASPLRIHAGDESGMAERVLYNLPFVVVGVLIIAMLIHVILTW